MEQSFFQIGPPAIFLTGAAIAGLAALGLMMALRKRYHRAIAQRERRITEATSQANGLRDECILLEQKNRELEELRDKLEADLMAGGAEDRIQTAHPNGHFYSPVVDPEEVAGEAQRIWQPEPTPAGLNFSPKRHQQILAELFPRFMPVYDYPETLPEDAPQWQFYTRNSQFSWLDCRTLFVLLNAWKPARYMEIGSGFSSLLAADVNHRMLDGKMHVSCVEPYPRPFLTQPVPGINEVIVQRVQEVPLQTFDQLRAGDILFIDSSHVAKTGSDVNYLLFDVLPRLAAGVRIHVHDIFLPGDYPRDWVLKENRSWNEQYVLQALLMDSSRYEIVFGSSFAFQTFPEQVAAALALDQGGAFGGGSLWLRVRPD